MQKCSALCLADSQGGCTQGQLPHSFPLGKRISLGFESLLSLSPAVVGS